MAVITPYRLSEEIMKLLLGSDPQAASNVTINELKISIGQVINNLLKIDYLSVNTKLGEAIPNGSVLATYDGIAYTSWKQGRSKATLPIKPLKLPRNMGVWSIYLTSDPTKEFIPLQMGQGNLIISQPMINELMGHVGYEVFGMEIVFTKDLRLLYPDDTLSMRLAVMDISQYDDWDILPILPEQEWTVKQEVFKMYSQEPIADKLVDDSVKEQANTPVRQQQQN
jgi:hypothetical protein